MYAIVCIFIYINVCIIVVVLVCVCMLECMRSSTFFACLFIIDILVIFSNFLLSFERICWHSFVFSNNWILEREIDGTTFVFCQIFKYNVQCSFPHKLQHNEATTFSHCVVQIFYLVLNWISNDTLFCMQIVHFYVALCRLAAPKLKLFLCPNFITKT